MLECRKQQKQTGEEAAGQSKEGTADSHSPGWGGRAPCSPGGVWSAVGWWRGTHIGHRDVGGMELTSGQAMAASFLFLFCVR